MSLTVATNAIANEKAPDGDASSTTLEEGVVNILIVDDEPKNLTVLETVLDSPRYRIIRAESADQALLELLNEEFAILILDVRMPAVTGFELAQMIRERKKTSEVPIIFLTAYYNEDQHIIEGYDSGAVDYLHKPINPAILRSKVAVLAELHLKQRQLEAVNRNLLAEVIERRLVQDQLSELNNTLEQRVMERTEAHRQAEEQIRLLMNEVNHRSKNILSVVMAVAQQTMAASPEEFRQRFANRVHALAVNHDLLVKSQWKSVDVEELVGGQLAHFGDLVGRRIFIDGQPLRLTAAAAQALGMALHELSTNAVKHGVLSGEEGSITIAWHVEVMDAGQRFTITWLQRGGLPVIPPAHRGFGTTVVTKMAQMSLDGEAKLDFPSSGLRWQLSCPVANALEAR
jgi:two-component sensor histidine kinase/FixJ family two-component response regulator